MFEEDFDREETDSQESWLIYFLTLSDPARKDHDFELVKVGITKGAVERRIASLQTGNPYQICRAAHFSSPHGRAIESWIHRTRNVKHLEWIRLPRNQIDILVEEAKRESERLATIAEAESRWKAVESNGRIRQPTAGDLALHNTIRSLESELRPTALQLSITLDRIALLAEKVWHVPGVVQIRRREAFKKFKSNLASERFPELVAQLTTETVQGRLYLKGLPNSATSWRELRMEAESLERRCKELNAKILADPGQVAPEGPRTDELSELHDRFLELMHKKARLDIDKQELRAQAIRMTEQWDGVEGLWSHKRSVRPKFDSKAFRSAFRDAAAACAIAGEPFIQRHVFFSRSY